MNTRFGQSNRSQASSMASFLIALLDILIPRFLVIVLWRLKILLVLCLTKNSLLRSRSRTALCSFGYPAPPAQIPSMRNYRTGLLPQVKRRNVDSGTHTYRRFVKPAELEDWGKACGLQFRDLTGLHYNPFTKKYTMGGNTHVNYVMHFRKET